MPTTDFFDKIMRHYGFIVDGLIPNVVNKIVGFEMPCWALGVLPQPWAFKYFFNSSIQSGIYTSSQRRGVNAFIVDQKAPKKNWQDRWLWVNQYMVSYGYPRRTNFSDRIPTLWGTNE